MLSDAMTHTGRIALAEMVSYNKENLVLIRSAHPGLILQGMYYQDEIRDLPPCHRGNRPNLHRPRENSRRL